MAVVGPAGSGKSSLLRAGLLPRLRRQAEQWLVLPALLPGSQPITNLAQALADASAARDEEVAGIEARLVDGGSDALVNLARKLARVGAGVGGMRRNDLVVIDQAEELSTRAGPQQQAFLDLLSRRPPAGQPRCGWWPRSGRNS